MLGHIAHRKTRRCKLTASRKLYERVCWVTFSLVLGVAPLTANSDEDVKRQNYYHVTYPVADFLKIREVDYQWIIKLVGSRTSTLYHPQSWKKNGGKGTLSFDAERSFLHVYNSQDVHHLLHELLIVDAAKDCLLKAIADHDLDEVELRLNRNRAFIRDFYRLTEYDKRKIRLTPNDLVVKNYYGKWVKLYPLSANGGSLLHVAAALGNAEIVKYILYNKSDVDHVDLTGRTALFYASNHQIAKILLNAQFTKPGKDSYGRTPLFYAREKDQIQLLVAAGYDLLSRDKTYGSLPIHVAAHLGNTRAVVAFSAMGNDINAVNKQGRTPLDEACRAGQSRTAATLLRLGATVKASKPQKSSVLHESIEGHCSNKLLAKLVSAGANVNDQANPLKDTPLHIAAKNGNVSATKFLLANGADVFLRNADELNAPEVAGSIDAYQNPDLQYRSYYPPASVWRKKALRKLQVFQLIQDSINE